MRMKDIFLPAIFLVSTATFAHAKWGVGLNVDHRKMDSRDLEKELSDTTRDPALAPARGEVTQGSIVGGLDVFYEGRITDSVDWGVSVGMTRMSPSELKESSTDVSPYDSSLKLENEAMSYPVSFYIRNSLPATSWSFITGLGMEFIQAETSFSSQSPTFSSGGKLKDEKSAPFFRFGVDYGVTPAFSVGLGLKYLFTADLSDFRGNVSGVSGESRAIMISDPYGEYFGVANTPLASGERPYKVDFGGVRIGLTAKYRFGA